MSNAVFCHHRCYAFLWWLVWLLLWRHVIPVKTLDDALETFEFTKPSYEAVIYEIIPTAYNSPTYENIRTLVTSTEKMGIFLPDPTMEVRYKILSGDDESLFKVDDFKMGDFCFLLVRRRIRSNLNRESKDRYTLRIKATPRGRTKASELLSDVTDVRITVLDTNELPPLFTPTEYNATVSEDTPVHRSILKVTAEDADVGMNGEVYYSLSERTEQFAVHPSTGVITLTRPLSYQERNGYELTVVAQDRISRSSRAKVRIRVAEANLHSPEIYVQHLPSIFEDGNVHVYAIVRVSDRDEGVHGQIGRVEITDGDPDGHFRIRPSDVPNEYNIAVLKLVDRELVPHGYNLTLNVSDRGTPPRYSLKKVTVRVTDRNDHAPVFDRQDYKVEVEEIAPIDTPLLNVRATDRDEGKNAEVSYQIVAGNEDGTFTMEAHTGWLLLARPLDAESRVTYILTVAAEDHSSSGTRKRGTCKVHVRVLDANDNDPVFSKDSTEAWVNENEFISTVIHTVKAEDADYGENGYVSYSIANLNPTPFVVDHFSGEVKMKDVLDYESMRRTYTLKIRASDWGTPFRRQSETTIQVRLKDINDNRPQFERVDCVGYLSRSAPRGTEVITLSAIDFDAGNIISYRFVSGNDGNCFSLDAKSGVVTLVCDLMTQKPTLANTKEHYLNFTATDGQHFADVMSVKITVVNYRNQELTNSNAAFQCRETGVAQRLTELVALVEKNNRETNQDVLPQLPGRYGENKHWPEFVASLPFEVEVNESVAVGTKLLDVKAVDQDRGFNGQVVYVISGGNVDGCFRVDMYNGSLFVVSPLDRERTSQYNLNVSAWDLGRPQKVSYRKLVINVGDANDNAPVFRKSSYRFVLKEDVAVGTEVVRLSATDRDVDENARITYSLSTNSEEFAVNAATGVLTVVGRLDRERQDGYELRVRAVDGFEEAPQTATAAVLVSVADVNDNVPRFARDYFVARVLEDLPVGTVVTTLTAYDPDLDDGGKVVYNLRDGDYGYFRVDRHTGTVRIDRKLDFEERKMYNITLNACDRGAPSLCSTVNLIVEVVDVNENLYAPLFSNFVANGSIKENQPIGTWVLNVTAIDNDMSELDSRIMYSIRDGNGLGRFSIDDNGNIYSLEVFDRETCSSYWLSVYAQDRGAVPLSSRLDVYIEILDTNDNVPQTKEPVYFPSVPENSPPGTIVVQIEVEDLDPDQDQHFTYRITSGNPQGFFDIDRETGLITTTRRMLDREKQEEHELEVSVSDNGDPVLSSSSRVVITITDVNDQMPQFFQQLFRIFEVPPLVSDATLFRVLALDDDIGSNAEITYSLKTGKLNGLFKIDPRTGVVYSQNLTAGQKYDLTIKAEDAGRPKKFSVASISLEVKQRPISSPNPPIIHNLNSVLNVVEIEMVGHLLIHVQATDKDGDFLFYEIIGGNAFDEFAINCNSGDLILTKQLDYELTSYYNLNISVTDGFHTVFAPLSIKVIDANDNRPQFSESRYDVEISENIQPNTDILQIQATDADSDKRLAYAIQSSVHPNSMQSFRIDTRTGVLSVNERLDRETLHTHILTVFAADPAVPSKRNFVRVIIKVKDHNDHAPIFILDRYEGKVYETSAIGTKVVQVQAIDRDKGNNAEIRYSIQAGNMGSAFSIDPVLGNVVVVKELDIQTMSEYVLAVKATDNGSPPLSSSTTIHITVTVADNAPPKFDKTIYSSEIQENLHEGSTVVIVNANSRSSVYYEIVDGNQDGLFDINPNSGTITCTQPLDYETNSFFNLTIRASNLVNQQAKCTVLVYVIDTNDNSPIFKKNLYVGNISENAIIGSVALDAEGMPLIAAAEDKDSELNALLVYEIVEKKAQKYFIIDPTTGAIRTLTKLDHETQSVFEFTVQASDMGKPQRTSEMLAKVKIFVNDVNDSPPVFESSQYNSTILLPTHPGILVASVKAHDPDTEIDTVLDYKIISGNGDNKFSMNSKTGDIMIANKENLRGTYVLIVRASDGVYAATTEVVITVEEMPVTGLRFGQEQYYANVMENSSEVSTVAVVNVIGTELNEHVIFSILNPEGLFTIGETSGVIRTTGVPFDREQKESYEIAVKAHSQYDESKKAHAVVHVNVMDINDNRPMFVSMPYYAVVPLSTKKGDVVFKVHAIDVDIGDNGEVNYELSDHRDEGVFQIHRKTGEITLKRTLDESHKEYVLRVLADDGGMDPLQAETTVIVKVIHSKMPVFKSQYYQTSVLENIQPYSPVLSIQANSPENRKLIYSIVEGNTFEEFAVDFNTDPDRSYGPCVIYVVDNLDYETAKVYNLTVRAMDSVSGEFADVPVKITVEDVNDNSPQFAKPVYTAYVSETAQPGTSIIQVEANDVDSGLNQLIQYHIVNDHKNSTDLFNINPDTGILSLKRMLDFEHVKVHDFVISAIDSGLPNLSSTARVWIYVQDRNDNAPYFEQPLYSCFLNEDAHRGQFITMVVAFDPDVNDQSKLTYAVIAGNDQQVFNINKKSGVIILGNPHKLKQFMAHTLNISVSDGVHTSYTRVKIDVISANSHSPEFTRVRYDVEFEENLPANSQVAVLQAIDNDSGPFGQVEYEFQSDFAEEFFSIDSESGKVTSKRSLDREAQDIYEIPVIATDAGGLIGYSLLRVVVTDKNDNPPFFRVNSYKANIPSTSSIGTTVVQVQAIDSDIGSAAVIEYSIYESNAAGTGSAKIFAINKQTGVIFLKQIALHFENQVFQFFVRAQDKGFPPLNADVAVDIFVTSPQDVPPKFHQGANQYFVQESAEIGKLITTLSSVGNESVSYSLASNYRLPDGNRPFSINEDSEIVVAGALDREFEDGYILVVKAETHTSPPLTAYANFTIQIMDENDNHPEFECDPYYVTVSENVKEGSSVTKIVARDKDIGHNGDVRFFLKKVNPPSEDGSLPFSIDSHTGWITTLVKLDRETVAKYDVIVVATDGGNPQLSSTTTVRIDVKDYNDNPPVFSQNKYRAAVNEDALSDTVVITLETNDADVDLNARVAYYITGGDPNGHFGIRHNGEIFVNKELDRESIPHYNLEITATDGAFVTTSYVSIDLLDANDSPPICSMTRYTNKISENIAPASYVLTVKATDEDEAHNAQLRYVLKGNDAEDFSLDDNEGFLKTARPLDRETMPRYLLTAHVHDKDHPDWECVSELEIILTDVNDNPPDFTQQVYSVTVPEDTEVKMLVSKVHATDKDIGINRKVRYSFVDSANGHFLIDELSGIITLAKPLDREEKAMFNLTVRVMDMGTPQLSSVAHLLVIVLDINDNPPEFASKYYLASIPESTRIGADVVRVLATSKDSGINAEITYSIVGGNEHGMFTIHKKAGVVSVQKTLDYETAKEYVLTIQANDGGVPSLSNHATVNISIIDTNDNTPTFTQSSYDAAVREDAQRGDKVLKVVAIDKDSGKNAEVYYSISRGDPKSQFRIDKKSGIITVASPLDRENVAKYTIEIQAVDSGSPVLSSTVMVNIEVTDVNDNPPVFSVVNHSAIIQEDKPPGTSIIKFIITDADASPNGFPFTYNILKGNEGGEFFLGKDGVLKSGIRFKHKLKSSYALQIRVYDNGAPPVFSDTWVNVKVIEESQYPPSIKPLDISVNSYNDEFPGGVIGRVTATDKDPYDTLTYAIISKHRQSFDIDDKDGTIKALPGLDVDIYRVNVSVTDGKFTKFSEVKISVNRITDEMLENAIILRLADVTPQQFIVTYHKSFQRAIKNVLDVRPKNIEILSIQPAVTGGCRNSRDGKQDLDVMFSVLKMKSGFHSAKTLRDVIMKNKNKIENEFKLKIVCAMDDLCTSSLCKNGECKSRLTFDDKTVMVVTTDTASYVSPQHHHRIECLCSEGYGGKYCDVIINECARATCAPLKICVPDDSANRYSCQCPPGTYGPLCSSGGNNCAENNMCTDAEKSPVQFFGKSYVAHTFISAMDRHFSLSLRIRTQQSRSCLMYAAGKNEYSILEVVNGVIQYRFDYGSGEGLVRAQNAKVNTGRWHEISLNRQGNRAELVIDNEYHVQGSAPGINVLDVESNDVYFGAEVLPDPSTKDFEDIRMGFVGCMEDIRMDGTSLPLKTSRFMNVELQCQTPTCGSQPCLNGGTCISSSGNAYNCVCLSRFSGAHCEIDTTPCASEPCLNGGTCSNRPNDFKCDCPSGLTGKRCEFGRPCISSPCQNGGTCEETLHGPTCTCDGYVGKYCQIDINECSKNPCQNGATCINTPGSYQCQCIPNTTGKSCEFSVNSSSITSNESSITIEEVIGIITTVAGILLLSLIFVLVRKYRLRRAHHRQNNDLPLESQKELVLKNKTQDDIKRTSKVSNLEAYSGTHHHPHVPPRPLSYTPSNHDSYNSALNNFETVRSYGSAGDDLENINRYSNEFLQTINKTASVPPSLPPPPPSNSPSDSDSLHKPWGLDNNLKDNYCDTKIQNDMKCHVGLPDVPLIPPAENFRDTIGVPSECIVPSLDEDLPDPPQGNDKGYHWDCSDWARSQNPLPNITEVPTNEVPDSPSVHSNESNSQVGGDDHSAATVLGPLDRRPTTTQRPTELSRLTCPLLTHSDEGDRDSEYVGGSEFNDNDLDDPGGQELLQPNFEQILSISGLDYNDGGSDTYRPSTFNYHLHPDQYLPNYDNITAANTDTEAEENSIIYGRGRSSSSNIGGVIPSPYGYLGHQRALRGNDPRRSLELPAADDMSVSVGGYTSTNASCSDISGNLCEIEDSEVCSDVDLDVEDLQVKKLVQNTASTAL